MEQLRLSSVKAIVKAGDTVSDIKEGVNAGAWSVGIIEGSSELGFSEKEWERLSASEKTAAAKRAEASFRNAGAHFVIQNMAAVSYTHLDVYKRQFLKSPVAGGSG